MKTQFVAAAPPKKVNEPKKGLSKMVSVYRQHQRRRVSCATSETVNDSRFGSARNPHMEKPLTKLNYDNVVSLVWSGFLGHTTQGCIYCASSAVFSETENINKVSNIAFDTRNGHGTGIR
jgi:hypothetical protein